MARTALIHLLRSQTKHLSSRSFHSGYQVCRYGTWSRSPSVKPDLNPAIQLATAQKRWMSQSSITEDEGKISIGPRRGVSREDDEKDREIVYFGPISSTIKKVKLISLSTCGLAVFLGPLFVFMASPDMNMILKGAMASSAMIFSASTTVFLHWFVNPYIHKLRWQPGSDSFEVEMLSVFATHMKRTIKFADIQPPETKRPFVSFKAGGEFYFIDPKHCKNKDLLARLMPHRTARESALKNKPQKTAPKST